MAFPGEHPDELIDEFFEGGIRGSVGGSLLTASVDLNVITLGVIHK
jgi:hypothetical protein